MWKLLVLMAAAIVSANLAQPDEQWYFGHNAEGVTAFNTEGESRLILETPADRDYSNRFWLGPSEALVTVTNDNTVEGLYYLTPDAAVALEGDVDLTLLESQGIEIHAYQYPYLVIEPRQCRLNDCQFSRAVWLANVETGQIEELAPHVFIGSPQALGMDGGYLRYASRIAPDVLRWELFERDLITGEERQFYRFSNSYPASLRASPTGEYWFYSYPTLITAGEHPEFGRLVIRADGSIETLDLVPAGEDVNFAWEMIENTVVKWPPRCESDCWIELRPVEGGTAQRFALPAPGYAQFLQRIDNNRILVEQEHVYWLLNASGEYVRLGVTIYGPELALSPDRQWLFTLEARETPTTFHLWNLQREEVALPAPLEEGYSLDYLEHGVFIHEFTLGMGDSTGFTKRAQDSLGVTLYRYSDGAIFTLPSDAYYFDVLANGDMLVSRHEDGIYRVNPATGEERLLVEGVIALQLRLPE